MFDVNYLKKKKSALFGIPPVDGSLDGFNQKNQLKADAVDNTQPMGIVNKAPDILNTLSQATTIDKQANQIAKMNPSSLTKASNVADMAKKGLGVDYTGIIENGTNVVTDFFNTQNNTAESDGEANARTFKNTVDGAKLGAGIGAGIGLASAGTAAAAGTASAIAGTAAGAIGSGAAGAALSAGTAAAGAGTAAAGTGLLASAATAALPAAVALGGIAYAYSDMKAKKDKVRMAKIKDTKQIAALQKSTADRERTQMIEDGKEVISAEKKLYESQLGIIG